MKESFKKEENLIYFKMMYYMFLKQMELSSAKGMDENCCSIYGIEYPQREAEIDYFFVHRFSTLDNEWL